MWGLQNSCRSLYFRCVFLLVSGGEFHEQKITSKNAMSEDEVAGVGDARIRENMPMKRLPNPYHHINRILLCRKTVRT